MGKSNEILEVRKFNEKGAELAIRFGLGAIKAVGVGAMNNLVDVRKEGGEFQDIYGFASRSGSKILNKKSIEALSKAGAFDNIHKNRHQILKSCEIICKYGSSKEEERNSDQMNLFGGQTGVEIENPALIEAKEWNKDERLQNEFEAFGFFVNEHPIDDYLTDLKKRGVISSDVLNEAIVQDNSIVKLAGAVAYSRHRSSPKGRFAYLTLSDIIGIYETSIFDEDLITDSRDLMESGNSLVVECLVRKDEGGTRLLVKKITELQDFIKETPARLGEFMDIKLQKRRGSGDWKNRNKSNSPEDDILALEQERNRRIEELKKKEIYNEVVISIKERSAIFNVKSFLSQKAAPEEIDKTTKIFIETGGSKIELADGYLIDSKDEEKLCGIEGVAVTAS